MARAVRSWLIARRRSATAQAIGCSGRELLAASVAGYEVGIRVGEFGDLRGTTYESNVLYTLRFMIDVNVVRGGGCVGNMPLDPGGKGPARKVPEGADTTEP